MSLVCNNLSVSGTRFCRYVDSLAFAPVLFIVRFDALLQHRRLRRPIAYLDLSRSIQTQRHYLFPRATRERVDRTVSIGSVHRFVEQNASSLARANRPATMPLCDERKKQCSDTILQTESSHLMIGGVLEKEIVKIMRYLKLDNFENRDLLMSRTFVRVLSS